MKNTKQLLVVLTFIGLFASCSTTTKPTENSEIKEGDDYISSLNAYFIEQAFCSSVQQGDEKGTIKCEKLLVPLRAPGIKPGGKPKPKPCNGGTSNCEHPTLEGLEALITFEDLTNPLIRVMDESGEEINRVKEIKKVLTSAGTVTVYLFENTLKGIEVIKIKTVLPSIATELDTQIPLDR